jgi:hypothetical protein
VILVGILAVERILTGEVVASILSAIAGDVLGTAHARSSQDGTNRPSGGDDSCGGQRSPLRSNCSHVRRLDDA